MSYKFYQVDAFTDKVFSGNPACIVPLEEWFSDEILLKIAKENAVAETAFVIDKGDYFHLRWFTPDLEIDLCGHATLATSFVLKSILKYPSNEINFKTLSGELIVKTHNDFYFLDFPARPASPTELPKEIKLGLNIQPQEIYKARDYLLIYNSQEEVENIKINEEKFNQINLGHGGVICTAKGNSSDFVSRFFTPQATILEDPVTGSAHCTLIPFWSNRLLKKELNALQISERGGKLYCKENSDRVIIGGQAKLFSFGEFNI